MGVLLLMNVFLIVYKEDCTLLSFVSHRWRCNRVLMIPLRELCTDCLNFVVSCVSYWN